MSGMLNKGSFRAVTALVLMALVLLGASGAFFARERAGAGERVGEETLPAGMAATVYMSPSCGCCGGYVEALEAHGFRVTVNKTDDMARVKLGAGVPAAAQSCHTTLVEGYVVEGHVPLEVLDTLLSERPEVDGVALPGMPSGTPGMPGVRGTLEVMALSGGELSPYLVLPGDLDLPGNLSLPGE